jgi:hypothetical protein
MSGTKTTWPPKPNRLSIILRAIWTTKTVPTFSTIKKIKIKLQLFQQLKIKLQQK